MSCTFPICSSQFKYLDIYTKKNKIGVSMVTEQDTGCVLQLHFEVGTQDK